MALNRRIGERILIAATQLGWNPVVKLGVGPDTAQRATLMDLSVTGAGLYAPTHPRARVDDLMIVTFNNARAVVDVRRVSPTDDSRLRYYGVEFVSMERAFERDVYEVIGRRSTGLKD